MNPILDEVKCKEALCLASTNVLVLATLENCAMDEHGLRFPAPMEDDMDPGKATKADPANSKAETTRSSTNTRTIELQNDSKIPPPQTDPTLQEGQRPSDDTEITSRQHRNSMLALLCIAVSVTAFVLQSVRAACAA